MLCRPHDLLAGIRFIPLAVLLLFAITVFLLSSRPLHPFSPAGDGVRAPAPTPETTAPAEPEREALLPLAPERVPVGTGRGVSFLYADEDGVVLSTKGAILESPDARSSLMLQRDGNLVLRSRDAGGTPNILWSTGTGDGRAAASTVRIAPAADGHLVLKVSATTDGAPSTLWHSDLLPSCAAQPRSNSTARRLELSSAGRLSLSGVCDIYAPPAERPARSLAVLLSGTYTANQSSCAQPLLAAAPFAAVDVFAHVSFEGADHLRGEIEDELRQCYGEDLRVAVVRPAEEAREAYPGGDEDGRLGACRGEMDDVSTRLKGLRDAGRAWWGWNTEHGAVHDTVLALRADAQPGERPRFRAVDELGETVVVVGTAADSYAYCPRMTGSVGIAPPDYITYGTPAAMTHYLNLHDAPSLPEMARLAGVNGTAHRGFFGCGVLPSGPRAQDCRRPVCAVECLVSWYLDSVGVAVEVEWW